MRMKRIIPVLAILCLGAALVFTGCDILTGGEFTAEKAGLYRIVNGEKIWEMTAGEVSLSNCLDTIRRDTVSGSTVNKYEIVLIRDEEIVPKYLSPLPQEMGDKYSFANKEITITARKNITIKQKPKSSKDNDTALLVVGTYDKEGKWENSARSGKVTLILGPNITLRGSSDNPWPLIQVVKGGTLKIQNGALITGNDRVLGEDENGGGGGGLEVFNGGEIIMDGGTVSHNTVTGGFNHEYVGGGGIMVSADGIFTMNGGVISDNKVSNTNYQGKFTIGGGIYAYKSTLTLKDGTIKDNTVEAVAGDVYGGGIYLDTDCTVELPDENSGSLTISGNTLTGPSGAIIKGGGIFVESIDFYDAHAWDSIITFANNTPDDHNTHSDGTDPNDGEDEGDGEGEDDGSGDGEGGEEEGDGEGGETGGDEPEDGGETGDNGNGNVSGGNGPGAGGETGDNGNGNGSGGDDPGGEGGNDTGTSNDEPEGGSGT
jgi:hypothetical protein